MRSKVYFSKEINNQSIMKIFEKAVNKEQFSEGEIGIKVHSGEMGGNNFVKPIIIKDLVSKLNGTIIDGNTPYDGNRNNNAGHWMTFREHGFTDIARCDLLDEDGDDELPVRSGKFLSINYIGNHLLKYDSFVMITHFKGHSTCGFGGALKDYSIGLASLKGKCWIHTAGQSLNDVYFPTSQKDFLDSMVDAMCSIKDLNKKFIFINIMNNLSIDGDGNANPRTPEIDDIGILASRDPVAIDKACIDMIYNLKGNAKNSMISRIEEKNGRYVIEEAYKRGIGKIDYELISL